MFQNVHHQHGARDELVPHVQRLSILAHGPTVYLVETVLLGTVLFRVHRLRFGEERSVCTVQSVHLRVVQLGQDLVHQHRAVKHLLSGVHREM